MDAQPTDGNYIQNEGCSLPVKPEVDQQDQQADEHGEADRAGRKRVSPAMVFPR